MNHQLTEAIAKRNLHNIKHLGKPPIWKYPRPVEIAYRTFIISIVKELRQHVLGIVEHLRPIILERDREHHRDAWTENLDNLLLALRVGFNNTSHKERIKAQLTNIGQKTSNWNDKQWQDTLVKVLGVDVYRRESFLGSHIKSFVQEGSSLITKLTEDTYNDVSRVITSGIRSGDRVDTIEESLMEGTDLEPGVFSKLETRARLIARDQIGKFNGELTRVRQEAIGIKEYVWHTSLDERVRDTHAALEGKTCNWDNGDEYSDDNGETWEDRDNIDAYKGQPGEDYQCRCWAEAVFPEEDLQEETDEEGLSDAEAEGRADGGPGSGNFGHAGRPGEIGGSGEGSSSSNKGIDKTKEIGYIKGEKEGEHGQEGTGKIEYRREAPQTGSENRGGTSAGGEGEGVDIRRSVGNSGRVIASHHTPSGDVYEVENPQYYRDNLSKLKSEHKYGSSVTLHNEKDYADSRTFIAQDGRSCFAITKDGDLQSVIHMENCNVTTDDLCHLAIRQGAKRLDCFDTVLPAVYGRNGFKEYKRDKWLDDYKPHDWSYDLYKKYNNGRPDIVYMQLEDK